MSKISERVADDIVRTAAQDQRSQKRRQFKECLRGICAAAGGTLLGHIGCIAKFGVLPILVTAGVVTHTPVAMTGVIVSGTALGLVAWHLWHRKNKSQPSKLERFVTYGMALVSIVGMTLWHNVEHHSEHEQLQNTTNVSYFNDEAGREFMVTEELVCGLEGTAIYRDTVQVSGPDIHLVEVKPPQNKDSQQLQF